MKATASCDPSFLCSLAVVRLGLATDPSPSQKREEGGPGIYLRPRMLRHPSDWLWVRKHATWNNNSGFSV